MKEWNKIEISDEEVMNIPPNFDIEHYVMHLCLHKGMPMTGSFSPQLDTDNYEYASEQDQLQAKTTYMWRVK